MNAHPIPARPPVTAAPDAARQAPVRDSADDGDHGFQAALRQEIDAKDESDPPAASASANPELLPAMPSDARASPAEQVWSMVAAFSAGAANSQPVSLGSPPAPEDQAGSAYVSEALLSESISPSATTSGKQSSGLDSSPSRPASAVMRATAFADLFATGKSVPASMPESSRSQSSLETTDPAIFAALFENSGETPQPSSPDELMALSLEHGINPGWEAPLAVSTATWVRDAVAESDATPQQPAPLAQSIPNPVGQDGWRDALGERVLWLANREISAAQIKLNPEHLGPVDVSIKLDGEGASIQFTAQNAGTREALEASAPRLREMFGAQHIALNEITVMPPPQPAQLDGRSTGFDFQRHPGLGFSQGSAQGMGRTGEGDDESLDETSHSPPAMAGLVNFFA